MLFPTTEGRSEGKSVSRKNNASWDCDCIVFLGTVPAGKIGSSPFSRLAYKAATEPERDQAATAYLKSAEALL